jgi:hypothetical protein
MLAKLKIKNQLIIKMTASCFIFILAVFLFTPIAVSAQSSAITEGVTAVGEQSGLTASDPRVIVGRIIKVALGLLGAVAISLVIYGGFLYMTAGGDEVKVGKARKVLINATIGMVIIFASYSIVAFITKAITGENQDGGGLNIAGGVRNSSLSGGAFGSIIQSQYPMPEQRNVPRNAMILVTFRLPVNPASVIGGENANYPCPNLGVGKLCGSPSENFKVARCESATLTDCKDIANDAALVPGYVLVSEDHRTFIFNPYGQSAVEHLGSKEEDWFYVVKLSAGIQKEGGNGQSIFSLAHPDHKWRFATSTVLDEVPPRVVSVVPEKNSLGVDLNSIVVVNFNEPVIPPLNQSQPCVGDSRNNEVQVINKEKVTANCTFNHIPGNFKVGINGYRSVKFISSTKCENVTTNSCGQSVYCLPANSEINGKVLAARLIEGCLGEIGTGITDMGGNSLDGNENGKCDGPGDQAEKDNVNWKFTTGNSLDLIPPFVTALSPANAAGGVLPGEVLTATMSEALDPETVDSGVELLGEFFKSWFDPNLGKDANGKIDMTKISIEHGGLMEAQPGQPVPRFTPVIKSSVQDLRQNCFSPSRDQGACKDLGPGSSCCPNLENFGLGIRENAANCDLPGAN